MTGDHPNAERTIRVFISSTFRDMQAEREELVKRVFPELRRLCEDRWIVCNEVDLRWGIPDELAAEGGVLPVCLAEIDACRPFFIGILGDRYGSVPDQLDAELIQSHPWLAECWHCSVTELEIRYAVLHQPSTAAKALFYFRAPAHRPADAREASERLVALEEQIRAQHRNGLLARAPREYPNVEAFGELVKRDLWELVEEAFPRASELDAVARESREHELFGASRARIYLGRAELFDALDAHVTGQGGPLVVLGESGGGKSALLANWVRRQRAQGAFVIEHYVGASTASTDCSAMLRRLIRSLAPNVELPTAFAQLRAAFASALHLAATQGRIVLVLDGLNQLEDRDQAAEMEWLPRLLPENVRLVCSTLPGRSLDALRERDVQTLTVEPLSRHERLTLISEYLGTYGKTLSQPRIERLAAVARCGNPLYLRTLLEELRQWGDHASLDAGIAHYLEAADPPELFGRVLERWERDFEHHRPHLVADALRRLWAARRGLSEAELLDMLGHAGTPADPVGANPLPQALWSPLYLAARAALVSRSGLLGFAHDYLRQAVEARYVPNARERQRAHLDLAGYFSARNLGARQVEELPWQLARAGAWPELGSRLVAPSFFSLAWQADEFEVKSYWSQIERSSDLRMAEAYGKAVEGVGDHRFEWQVAFLLSDTGHIEPALHIRERLVTEYRTAGDPADLQQGLGNLANLYFVTGRLDEALALYREQETICRQHGYQQGFQSSIGNQANILYIHGDLDGASALYEEQARICEETGNTEGLQSSLGNRANLSMIRGRLEEALSLNQERVRICKATGNLDGLQITFGNQANILLDLGELDDAELLYQQQRRICIELGNLDGLETNLGNHGTLLYQRGDLDAAMAQFEEQERICRQIGHASDLSSALGNQGLILQARDRLDEALARYREQERICRQLGDRHGLQRSLGNQGTILHLRGDLEGARRLYEEQSSICREVADPEGLAQSLTNQAVLLRDEGHREPAVAFAREALQLTTQHGYAALTAALQDILETLR